MNKKGFRIVSVLVAFSLVALIVLQGISIINSYENMNIQFSQKVKGAMERAAYDELITRSNGLPYVSMDSSSTKKIDDIPAGNIKAITIDKRKGANTVHIQTNDAPHSKVYIFQMRYDLQKQNFKLESYDTLLSKNLEDSGITSPYRLSLIDRTSDDVNIKYLHEEIPDPIAISIFLDTREEVICTVEMENPGRTFLKEMRWIIISSVLILLLLVFTFWYLVRVLFRQKSLEEMRSDFTHNITHELKTPIAVANAANDAMLNFGADREPSKRIEYLTVVHNQLALLSDMVQRILSITSLEKGNYKISPSECSLNAIIEEVSSSIKIKYSKPITITSSTTPQEITLRVDEFHFKNVLTNLLDNSAKYSGKEVNITINCVVTDSGSVRISIADDGIGISPSDCRHIFEKFYRVPTGNLHDIKGSGLGLYYANLIIKEHGGSISVKSILGRGTEFIINLPE